MPSRADTEPTPTGRLVVTGIGIQLAGQVTLAAQAWIRRADQLFYIAASPATAAWLSRENPTARSLRTDPPPEHSKADVYDHMIDPVLEALREQLLVCLVSYGHPGVLVGPVQRAVERARAEGFSTRMLPGISAEDCLFADLGSDPGETGWQSYDATDFLIHGRKVDPSAALILYQVAMVGSPYHRDHSARGLPVLKRRLAQVFGEEHEVLIYEAAALPALEPRFTRRSLAALEPADISPESLLYVPPSASPELDAIATAGLAHAHRDA